MSKEALFASYMAAHILVQTGTRVDASWSAEELMMGFNLLPKPRVSFEAWAERMGAQSGGPRKYTNEEIWAHNEKGDRWFEEQIQAANARKSA